MVPWKNIETVLLDMDGTLLDLYFDTHFWTEHLPLRHAERLGLDVETAKRELFPRYKQVEGTLNWYCLDYWSRELALNIPALKEEVVDLITVHAHAVSFLDALRAVGKRTILVSNAHAKSLSLKMLRTGLAQRLDGIVCAHDVGIPKEHPDFWSSLRAREFFRPEHTLLIDDSLTALRSARAYGIAHLLTVYQPDSHAPPQETQEFQMVRSFLDIMPSVATGVRHSSTRRYTDKACSGDKSRG